MRKLDKGLIASGFLTALGDTITTVIGLQSPFIVETNPLGVVIPTLLKVVSMGFFSFLFSITYHDRYFRNLLRVVFLVLSILWLYNTINNIYVILTNF